MHIDFMNFSYKDICGNCGNLITGRFCSHCGGVRIKISEEVENEIENSFVKNTYEVECNNCSETDRINSISDSFIKFCSWCGSNDVNVIDTRLKRYYCHKCGKDLIGKFCSHCGSERNVQTNVELIVDITNYIIQCKQCNAEFKEYGYSGNSVKFCKECGSLDIVKFDATLRRDICNKCGCPVDGRYCSHCGTEITFKDKDSIPDRAMTYADRYTYFCESCGGFFDAYCKDAMFCTICGKDKIKTKASSGDDIGWDSVEW